MRPPRSGAAHSLYAGVRGNLLRPLPAPCVGMRSREQNAPRVLWNTGQIDRARFRFATAGLSVEASLRVEVPPQDLATESTGTASHWGQERSSMDEGGCHRSHAVFHPDHRVPPIQPLQPLTTVCQYPAGLRLRAPGLELKRFQNAYGAPPPRLDGRIVGIGTPASLGPWIQGRVRCLRLRIPRTGPTSVFTGPAVGRYVQDVANVTSPDHNFSIPNSRTLRKIQGGTSALGRSPQSRRANQAAFRPRITSASPEIKQRVGRRSSAVRRRE